MGFSKYGECPCSSGLAPGLHLSSQRQLRKDPVVPERQRMKNMEHWRQVDQEFKVSLGYI